MPSQTNLEELNQLYALCKKVNENERFIANYNLVYKIGVLCDLSFHSNKADVLLQGSIKKNLIELLEALRIDKNAIRNLLKSASLFASLKTSGIESEDHIASIDNLKNKAYRITISLYYYHKFISNSTIAGEDIPQLFNNTEVIYSLFTKLGILSKIRNENIDDLDVFSFSLEEKLNFSLKEFNNRISVAELAGMDVSQYNDEMYLSDFQRSVFHEKLLQDKSVIISAPTSAGKTFVVQQYILYKILAAHLGGLKINVAFIVPTKALINELKMNFHQMFKAYGLDEEINLNTHISGKEYFEKGLFNKINLFIFTQERLTYFYSDLKFSYDRKIQFEFIAVDEAHKIGYGYRGTLLNYIINELLLDSSLKQICFLTPLLRNLSKLKTNFHLDSLEFKFSNFGLVAKNLIVIKKEGMGNWNFYLKINDSLEKLFSYKRNTLTQPKYLATFASLFTTDGATSLLYRRYPADTIKQAKEIKVDNLVASEELDHLKSYIKDTVSDDYDLIALLGKGIAFHNGQLPLSIKSSVEDLYKNSNLIKFLCVNSTVLEGVNLPAKNIFIGADAKDHSRFQLSSLDLKNLVGRAGRLNQHMSGNIFLIDYGEYSEKITNEDDNTEEFSGNLEKLIHDESKFDKFLHYLTGNNYKNAIDKDEKNMRRDFEYMTGYLLNKYIRFGDNGFDSSIKKLIYSDSKDDKIELLKLKISTIYADKYRNTRTDLEFGKLLSKNLFIDPRRQIDLYEDYMSEDFDFYSEIYEKIYEAVELFRKKCNDTEKLKRKEMLKILVQNSQKYFIQKYKGLLTEYFDKENIIFAIIHQWITEVPLKEIISSYSDIAETLKVVNEDVQFSYFHALKVYTDIIELVYLQRKQEMSEKYEVILPEELEVDLTHFMELGAYLPDTTYLISKGVDRETALLLKRTIYKDAQVKRKYGDHPKDFFMRNKEVLLGYLRLNNYVLVERELKSFIY